MTAHESEERMAVKKYGLLLDLWKVEGQSQVYQLMVLLAVNALLVLAFFLAEQTPWVALVSFLLSFVWIILLGHSVSSQDRWQAQMDILSSRGAQYALLQIHRAGVRRSIWGLVPPRYYLLGTPIAAAVCWLVVLVFTLLA